MDQNYGELLASLSSHAEGLNAQHEQAVQQYTPVVEGILATRVRDVRSIEQTLDRFLGSPCHPGGFAWFKHRAVGVAFNHTHTLR